jgi:uncharacterized membrane protein
MRGRARQVPVAVYVGGAFLLDFLWVAFGVTGIDPTPWSDWSHSLVMAVVWATAFAAMFVKFGRAAIVSVWLIVFSHYVLDLLVQGATVFPYAPQSLLIPVLVTTHAWALQLVLSAAFLVVFVRDEWKVGALSWRTLAACALVVALSFR